jgi:hypothetical protein
MAATLPELQAMRAALVAARAAGTREVRDGSSGDAIVYKSDSEMAAALAALDSEIAALTRGPQPSVVRFSTSKGL